MRVAYGIHPISAAGFPFCPPEWAPGEGVCQVARVVIAGASGFIGERLVRALQSGGDDVRRLVRRPAAGPGEVAWDPARGLCDPSALDGVDVVINLAGRKMAPARWTSGVRREILESRTGTTRLLVETMGRTTRRPAVFLTASGIGIYGDRGDETLTEASAPGGGFLADVVRIWEAEAVRAAALGVRVVCLRQGLILSRDGGFLAPLLPVFRLGLGGPFGNGRQWWSWVHMDDVIACYRAAMRDARWQGPVNVVAPHPVTNREFARTLARELRRPALLPVPAVVLRAVFGQMGDETLLFGQRVGPSRLLEHGFAFRWPELGPALKDLVGRRPAGTR